MELGLNEAQANALAIAETLAVDRLAPVAARGDREERFPTEILREIGRRGLMGVNISPEYGGLGAGVVAYANVVRAMAGACAGTTVAMMVTNMVAEAVQSWGDEDLKRRVLPRITSGEWAAAGFSLSEPGSGSDAASLRTTAVRDGDHYVLDGRKAWVTSGGHAGIYLVMARTDPAARAAGISAFLVEADTPGLSAAKPEEKAGLRTSATTELLLEGCRVPARNRLGDEGIGFKVAMNSLDGGRVGVSAQALGVGFAALRTAAAHLVERGLDPADQGRQWLLADCATELEAGWLLCMRAASMKDAGQKVTREAAMSKVFCTEAADRACQRALELMGEEGFTDAHEVERYARDVRITRIYEGTSEVQRIVVAREILRGFAV